MLSIIAGSISLFFRKENLCGRKECLYYRFVHLFSHLRCHAELVSASQSNLLARPRNKFGVIG
jgi:hypothetical protein